ncbi:hypothetical protein [Marinactinospora rubrisoli]|uniref:Uncharacterized protein n=1 Tax=Marinactinospora rubrisoli TaxID=2715399 RepID=A0ABW2KCB3_9ACTN
MGIATGGRASAILAGVGLVLAGAAPATAWPGNSYTCDVLVYDSNGHGLGEDNCTPDTADQENQGFGHISVRSGLFDVRCEHIDGYEAPERVYGTGCRFIAR